MPQVRSSCPRCRQPVIVDAMQVFDVNADPQAKERFLSGEFNMMSCPSCGFQGPFTTHIVYHDPEKEFLLTYFPPELRIPMNEQEKIIGPLITQITNRLPLEKRKAYLLRPQVMLTLQTMIERVLEGDGITKEMIDEQQKRLNLLQRLLAAPSPQRVEIIKAEEASIDEPFFLLVDQLMQASMGQPNRKQAETLAELQKDILENTEIGKQIRFQVDETQAAIRSLQEASQKGLTREDLLELIINAPSEIRLGTLVTMARSGIDYLFYQTLTERINQATGDEAAKLIALRDKILDLTEKIDQEMKEHEKQTRELLEKLIAAPNTEEALEELLPSIDETFLDVLNSSLQAAKKSADLQRSAKLQKIMDTIRAASQPPPEIALVNSLLQAGDENEIRKILDTQTGMDWNQFHQILGNLVGQMEPDPQSTELVKRLKEVQRVVLRYSMEKNLAK